MLGGIMDIYKDGFKDGQWDIFELITSAYFGKRYYFVENDGHIYSRYSHKYMSFDEAVIEFCSFITDY